LSKEEAKKSTHTVGKLCRGNLPALNYVPGIIAKNFHSKTDNNNDFFTISLNKSHVMFLRILKTDPDLTLKSSGSRTVIFKYCANFCKTVLFGSNAAIEEYV
jgi:hypothetical protein